MLRKNVMKKEKDRAYVAPFSHLPLRENANDVVWLGRGRYWTQTRDADSAVTAGSQQSMFSSESVQSKNENNQK